MEEPKSEIVKSNQTTDLLNTENARIITNIKVETKEDQIKMFNLMSRCDARLNDVIGEVLFIKQYHFQQFVRKDKETGQPRTVVRTILVDENGKSYVTLSSYFALQFKRLVDTFGDAINDGVKIRVIKQQKQNAQGEILQFELISDNQTEMSE